MLKRFLKKNEKKNIALYKMNQSSVFKKHLAERIDQKQVSLNLTHERFPPILQYIPFWMC